MTPELELPLQDSITSLVPVPESVTDCGLPVALSVMLSVAVNEPAAAGVKATSTVHAPPAASELPQVSATSPKSLALVPAIVRLLIVMAAVPVLVSVTV
jgi:hypothetical protein